MSNLIPGNQKHLSLEDRIYIEKSLNDNKSFKDIARFLCKDPSTISKEIKGHRLSEYLSTKGYFSNERNHCIHRFTCKLTNVCNKIFTCDIKCASAQVYRPWQGLSYTWADSLHSSLNNNKICCQNGISLFTNLKGAVEFTPALEFTISS